MGRSDRGLGRHRRQCRKVPHCPAQMGVWVCAWGRRAGPIYVHNSDQFPLAAWELPKFWRLRRPNPYVHMDVCAWDIGVPPPGHRRLVAALRVRVSSPSAFASRSLSSHSDSTPSPHVSAELASSRLYRPLRPLQIQGELLREIFLKRCLSQVAALVHPYGKLVLSWSQR